MEQEMIKFFEKLMELGEVSVGDGFINIKFERIPKVGEDSKIDAERKEFTESLQSLDDSLFVEVIEDVEDMFDFQEFDTLLTKKNLTEEEEAIVKLGMNIIKTAVVECIDTKIDELEEIQKRFL